MSTKPFFSIIIPAYKNQQYLSRCLNSVQTQDFSSWEAIVVIDGSPDNSAEIAMSYEKTDERFKTLVKSNNEGTHLARRSGVENCCGEYSIFLDADDELNKDALMSLYNAIYDYTEPFDVFHFGTELFGEDMPEDTCNDILLLSNRPFSEKVESEIPQSSFTASDDSRQDWRVLQRVYRTKLLKKAFSAMTVDRLGRGQDSYEWMVIASLSRKEIFRNDLLCYKYYLGRGITTNSTISKDRFLQQATSYIDLINACNEWSKSFDKYDLQPCVEGLKTRLYEMLLGDWHVRLKLDERIDSSGELSGLIGKTETAAEIMRLTRDVAYEQWISGSSYSENSLYMQYYNLALDIFDNGVPSQRYIDFKNAAERHINDLKSRKTSCANNPASHRHGGLRMVRDKLYKLILHRQ